LNATELERSGVDIKDLLLGNKTAAELLAKGFAPQDLYEAGAFTLEELQDAVGDVDWVVDEAAEAEIQKLAASLAPTTTKGGGKGTVAAVVVVLLLCAAAVAAFVVHTRARAQENPIPRNIAPSEAVSSNHSFTIDSISTTGGLNRSGSVMVTDPNKVQFVVPMEGDGGGGGDVYLEPMTKNPEYNYGCNNAQVEQQQAQYAEVNEAIMPNCASPMPQHEGGGRGVASMLPLDAGGYVAGNEIMVNDGVYAQPLDDNASANSSV
jgi:hypothetical protein